MTVWIWNEQAGRLEEPSDDFSTWTLQAADSWFVQDGRVRALDRHRARFTDAAAQVGLVDVVTDDFWAAVVEKLPATGEWFPRVDVLESPSDGLRVLAFRLRPAPQRSKELRVLVPSYSDPRTTPGRKGPDIALLEQLRTQARTEYDCDEVLLLSEDGYVIEGATTSLLWWDADTLCAPDPELGSLAGVSSAMIIAEARGRLIPAEYRCARPVELVDQEVWLVNALHGIRRVREFVDGRDGYSGAVLGDSAQSFGTVCAGRTDAYADRFNRWHGWLEAISVSLGTRRPARLDVLYGGKACGLSWNRTL